MLYSLPAQWLQHSAKKQKAKKPKATKANKKTQFTKPGIPKPQKRHKSQTGEKSNPF